MNYLTVKQKIPEWIPDVYRWHFASQFAFTNEKYFCGKNISRPNFMNFIYLFLDLNRTQCEYAGYTSLNATWCLKITNDSESWFVARQRCAAIKAQMLEIRWVQFSIFRTAKNPYFGQILVINLKQCSWSPPRSTNVDSLLFFCLSCFSVVP